ncbi:MAG: hypothetical protein J6P03_00855, partial [Opitutales bacterium]|nr:hypothetical protein [Opitutales bacterium]
MAKIYLGLDASTQSMSAMAIDLESGEIVYSKNVNFGADLPQYKSPSGYLKNADASVVHSDPMMWLESIDMLFSAMRGEGFD